MLTSNYGALSPIPASKVYPTKAGRDSRVQTAAGHKNYDSVTLSAASGDSRFHMDLVSRLSQEVRTATTTGDIANLRQQVASGQYAPDPMSIAARILFLGEGR
ncbi:MAG: flagellar biosynthesis anti-sigma factor FlgM [Lawsonibacter sp.]|nr:flagellar biosynthesis anti-sigma factor FlgM [Lawsonibacter sp.]